MTAYNTPVQIAAAFGDAGVDKDKASFPRFMLLAILGGAFIALGGLLTVIVAGGMPGVAIENPGLVKLMAGMLFPVGLIMVSVAGADLFTSDCAVMVTSYMQRKTRLVGLVKIWILAYVFNFVGTQLIAYFSAYVGLFANVPYKSYLYGLAEAKINQDFLKVFVKGIGANWLVCLGTWMGYAGKDITGKCLGIWIPVMIFVTLGLEHSIANMFFIPAAIYADVGISWSLFVSQNLIPATLGNIVGGAVFVGMVYSYIYKNKN